MTGAARGLQIKAALIATGLFTDSLPTHVVAGLGAGFLAVCIGSPVDVVKSRIMGALPVSFPAVSPGAQNGLGTVSGGERRIPGPSL